MGINIKSIGSSVLKGINNAADGGGGFISKGLQKVNIVSDAVQADKIGKFAMYGAMGGGALGAIGNLDEYQYGFGNGIIQTGAGTIGGAELGAVGVGGATAVATAIAKGLR